MEAQPLTLGTAGHIDHGKTVLVQALTGVDTDRLPEEQARGISIELGFAPLELPSGRRVSVVDVPGHERFVRTMVAGATGIDMFLLVVAADDGVMPQTREHLRVLQLLGVPAGVVALTKADAAGTARLGEVGAEVRALLDDGPYSGAEIVPVAAAREENVPAVAAAIDRTAAGLSPRGETSGPARLHVDRVFSLRGIGTVVTGTLRGGPLAVGDPVVVEPRSGRARVRSLQVHGADVGYAAPGQRVAANLAGLGHREVRRGDVVAPPDSGLRPAHYLDAELELVSGAGVLRSGARVQVHHGTAETPARVAPLEGDRVDPGTSSLVQLRLERPLVAAAGDRFVLRQIAPPDTIGGGVVIDAGPRRHGPGDAQVERLRSMQSRDPLERLAAELSRAPSGMGREDADPEALARLAAAGVARRVGSGAGRYFDPAPLDRARARLMAALDGRDDARPAGRDELARAADLSPAAALAVLEDLVTEGRVEARAGRFLPAGRPAATTDPVASAVAAALAQDELEPRGVAALAAQLETSPAAVDAALRRLVLDGAVVRVNAELHFEAAALERARTTVRDVCRREGSITIARLRDELGTSRRYAQALLERFDGERLLLRRGDEHVLRRRSKRE